MTGMGIALVLSLLAPAVAPEGRAKAIETMNEGVALVREHELAKAEAKLIEATTVDPSYAHAWLNLGVLHQNERRLEAAAAAFGEGLPRAEGAVAVELRYRLGAIVLERSDEPGLSRAERNARVAEALGLLQRVARDEPQRSQAHLGVARCFEHLDRPAEADAAYRRAIEANPRLTAAYAELGMLYIDHGHVSVGIVVLEVGTTVNELDASAWNGLGLGLKAAGQPAEAITAYERARKLDPDRADVLFGLGMSHAELGQRAEGIEALEAFLSHAGSETPEHIRVSAMHTIARLQDVI